MTLDVFVIQPLVALIAGILILLIQRILNYVVAIYLIFIGLVGMWPRLFHIPHGGAPAPSRSATGFRKSRGYGHRAGRTARHRAVRRGRGWRGAAACAGAPSARWFLPYRASRASAPRRVGK